MYISLLTLRRRGDTASATKIRQRWCRQNCFQMLSAQAQRYLKNTRYLENVNGQSALIFLKILCANTESDSVRLAWLALLSLKFLLKGR